MKKFVRKFNFPLIIGVFTFVLSMTIPSLILAATFTETYADSSLINSGASSNQDVSGGQLKIAQGGGILGDGRDRSCTTSTTMNLNTTKCGTTRAGTSADAVSFSSTANTSAGSGTIVLSSTPTGLAVGDVVLIINLQRTSTNYANVGKYEEKTISAINSTTLSFTSNLTNGYDGTTQKIMVQRIPQYTNVTVNSGGTITGTAWAGTKNGVVMFKASGTVTVNSGGSISASQLGYRVGAHPCSVRECQGGRGESYKGAPGNGTTASGGGGGGGNSGSSGDGAGGGGGYGTNGASGGSLSDGTGGAAGVAYGVANLSSLYLGSGGGKWELSGTVHYPAGGIVGITANTITVSGGIKGLKSQDNLPSSFWKLNGRQQSILSVLENPGEKITNKDVQKKFGVSQITASRDLSHLTTLGLLLAHGKGRSVYYTKV